MKKYLFALIVLLLVSGISMAAGQSRNHSVNHHPVKHHPRHHHHHHHPHR